jgi:hypothetical protein
MYAAQQFATEIPRARFGCLPASRSAKPLFGGKGYPPELPMRKAGSMRFAIHVGVGFLGSRARSRDSHRSTGGLSTKNAPLLELVECPVLLERLDSDYSTTHDTRDLDTVTLCSRFEKRGQKLPRARRADEFQPNRATVRLDSDVKP